MDKRTMNQGRVYPVGDLPGRVVNQYVRHPRDTRVGCSGTSRYLRR